MCYGSHRFNCFIQKDSALITLPEIPLDEANGESFLNRPSSDGSFKEGGVGPLFVGVKLGY